MRRSPIKESTLVLPVPLAPHLIKLGLVTLAQFLLSLFVLFPHLGVFRLVLLFEVGEVVLSLLVATAECVHALELRAITLELVVGLTREMQALIRDFRIIRSVTADFVVPILFESVDELRQIVRVDLSNGNGTGKNVSDKRGKLLRA
jgi:hypothetical protein